MAKEEREIAEKAIATYRMIDNFKANQTVTFGQVYVQAQLKFKKPYKTILEYQRYQDPMLDLEEELTGGHEFSTQDLTSMQIVYNGRNTWFHHRQSDLAIRRIGKVLPSPLGQTEVMAQIGFLKNLTSDYLLRDEGEGTVNNRKVRRLGIKPKARRRSLFLKEEIFDFERGTLALDSETWFPLKITSYPRYSEDQITVEYQDVKLDEIGDEDFNFDPPADVRIFHEKLLKFDEVDDQLPFELDTAKLDFEDYQLASDNVSVIVSKDNERAYGTLNFYQTPEEGNKSEFGLTLPHGYQLKFGNYLSKNMNRRKAYLSDNGEEIALGRIKATLVNRGKKVGDQLPHVDQLDIFEIGWQKDGVFFFLLGQSIKQDELIAIAENMAG